MRAVSPLLPAWAHRRFRWAAAGGIVLALLDAAAVVMILPLLQLLTSAADTVGDDAPAAARAAASLLGRSDVGELRVALALVVFGAFTVKAVAAIAILRASIRTTLECEADVARRLLDAYLDAPLQFHLSRNTAELQRTVHESVRRVFQDGLAFIVPALADAVVIAVIAAALLALAPLEAMVGGVWVAVLAVAYRRAVRQRAIASSTDLVEQSRRSFEYTQQALASVREIKVTGTRRYFTDLVFDARQSYGRRQAVLSLTEQLPRYYLEVGLVVGAGLMATAAFATRSTDGALAVLGVAIAGTLRLLPSLNRALNAAGKADSAMPHVRQLLEDLAAAAPAVPEPGAHDEVELGGIVERVRFEDLEFAYPAGEPVLRDVCFEILRGEFAVIVGSSGAGKTTLVSLLLGLIDPSAGRILVNDTDLASCRSSWHRRVAYVPQDVTLLDTTIAENVTFGRPDAGPDAVWAALEEAEIADFVRSLPDGLASRPGERGARISGGQRQRLGLARAFYGSPEILVLDEATSSLDTATERRILETLLRHAAGRTVILVTHRLTTARHADRIVVLADGSVEAVGTSEYLETASPTFAHLLAAQGERAVE